MSPETAAPPEPHDFHDVPGPPACRNTASLEGGSGLRATLLLLSVPLAWSAWQAAAATWERDPARPIRTGVDPNTAPWWELTALPGIGPATAWRIVEFREARGSRRPLFRRPADLEPVPDIGPQTILRIAPHLDFGAAPASAR